MPHKIGFRVAYVSGEDEKFRAKELNSHGPTVRGWQSPKFCIYPQELIIQLDGRTHICKLQILSHQSLIATEIELFIGDVSDNVALTPQTAKYKKLGVVTLSDNEKTNYKARELKSIHVDSVGTFIRFVIQKNHVNRNNLCNQVGIVAVNVIGDDVNKKVKPEGELLVNGAGDTNPPNSLFQKRPDYVSPLDDLSFDMYQDPEVALIIRKLEAKKQQSVLAEQYEYAKKLKNAVSELHKAGEKLGKYEIEKRQAKEMEDFDKASQKQKQMEDYRMEVYERLALHELMETQMLQSTREKSVITESSSRPASEPKVIKSPKSPEFQEARVVSPRAVSPRSLSPNTFEAYENRMIPALRKRDGAPEDHPDDDSKSSKTYKGIMSEKDLHDAALPIDVFGMKLVEEAYSKTFSERNQALKSIQRQLKDFVPSKSDVSIVKMFRASVFLIVRALRDKVLAVFTQSLSVVTTLLTKFSHSHRVNKTEMTHAVDKILPELMIRTGDSSPRVRSSASDYILHMADFPEVRSHQVVPSLCCQPLTSSVMPRLAQSRAEIVEQLTKNYGVNKNGYITTSAVMNFCVPALEHPVGPVRETAERIIVDLYRERGKEIRKYLPQDETSRRNMMYRQLFDELDKIDIQRPPPKNGKKASTKAYEPPPPEKPKVKAKRSQPQPQQRKSSYKPELSSMEVNSSENDGVINLDDFERTCIFCGVTDDSFVDEGLDRHYWKTCPMLIRCSYCKQVVEIAALTDHLLSECIAKDRFDKCERCQEAVLVKGYDNHVKLKACIAAKPDKVASHCPLCHKNIPPGEEGWRNHLMEIEGCEKNPRRVT